MKEKNGSMTYHRFQRTWRAVRALCCVLALSSGAMPTPAEAAETRPQLAAYPSRTSTARRGEMRSELGAPTTKLEESGGAWGWLVVLPSLAAGAALLGYGLSIDCKQADIDCQRKASLAIWGSVGVASLGSLLGLCIVEKGKSPAPPPGTRALGAPSQQGVRLELAPTPAAQGLSRPTGALVQLTTTLD